MNIKLTLGMLNFLCFAVVNTESQIAVGKIVHSGINGFLNRRVL